MANYYGWVPKGMSDKAFMALSNREKRSLRRQRAREVGRHTDEEWRALLKEFDGRCVKCGKAHRDLCRDHIVPLYQDPDDRIENIQPLCRRCNSSKGPDATNWKEHRREHGFE